ncbi:unnamed protein product [Cuscuta epithymum]|uniref:Serine incorporator n=1 Tax=Cuscuta epithymum TaxID=186058 RepID=A0AAV0G862_9ASTE|nr:unnamed protein product [Cuscuta epithymum]
MAVGEGDNTVTSRYTNIRNGAWYMQFRNGSNPWMARYAYILMFTVTSLLAVAVRDYGFTTLNSIKVLKDYCNGGEDCSGIEGVLRVSLGCFMFYLVMFVSTVRTSKVNDRREKWHSGMWIPKILMMAVLIVIAFLLPTIIISIYGKGALLGAGIFLAIQLISILSCITWLSNWCYSNKSKWNFTCKMLLGTIPPVLVLTVIIFMFVWYAPHRSCLIVVSILIGTILIFLIMGVFAYRSSKVVQVEACYLNASLMALYVEYICWSTLKSIPQKRCMLKGGNAASKLDWLTISSFVVAVLAIVISTFSTGINSKRFLLRQPNEQQQDDDVPYGYGFLHFVFATATMLFSMQLVGWNDNDHMNKFTIDIGWIGTWVGIVHECVVAAFYVYYITSCTNQAAEGTPV